MLKLVVFLCTFCVAAIAASFAWAGEPTAGTLSVERGKGVVMVSATS